MVIKGRFGQESGVNPPKDHSYSVELLNDEQRRAFGYLTQIYGTLVTAGLYTDSIRYSDINNPGMVGVQMRRKGACEHAPWVVMSFTRNDHKKHWEFRYRCLYISMTDLDDLAMEAHTRIAQLENRKLRALMGNIARHQRTEVFLRSV